MDIDLKKFKEGILKQDNIKTCFNKEYQDMMACITGAAEFSIEEIERFLMDYDELNRINDTSVKYVEDTLRKKFNELKHQKRKGRLL